MKTALVIFLLILGNLPSFIFSQEIVNQKTFKFNGTYLGLNEDVEFEFLSDDDKIYVFHEIAEEVTVDLYEEKNFEKKFEVTWCKKKSEVVDEEGIPTGEHEEYLTILSLKEIK